MRDSGAEYEGWLDRLVQQAIAGEELYADYVEDRIALFGLDGTTWLVDHPSHHIQTWHR